jgi:hypothetical protein
MTRTIAMLGLLLALPASAQSASDEPGYALAMIVAVSPALVFDSLVINHLLKDGTVRKGFAMNAVIFGGVAATIGVMLALTFWGDTRVKPIWTPLGVGVAVVGAGSSMLGVWGLLHKRPEAEVLQPVEPSIEQAPDQLTPSAPPLVPAEIPMLRIFPSFGFTRSGAVTFGLTGAM